MLSIKNTDLEASVPKLPIAHRAISHRSNSISIAQKHLNCTLNYALLCTSYIHTTLAYVHIHIHVLIPYPGGRLPSSISLVNLFARVYLFICLSQRCRTNCKLHSAARSSNCYRSLSLDGPAAAIRHEGRWADPNSNQQLSAQTGAHTAVHNLHCQLLNIQMFWYISRMRIDELIKPSIADNINTIL